MVTCDYEANPNQTTLLGTREDAKEMKKTFECLDYAITQLHNPTKAKIQRELGKVSRQLTKYKGDIQSKVIIFAFSGHGCSESQREKIIANDGEKLDVSDEIVLPLVAHKDVEETPKLFFIDACRGTDEVVRMKGGKGNKQSDEVYFSKLFEHVEGNYRIDYSTIPDHVSYLKEDGSIWMSKLARALREEDDSVQHITTTVRGEVRKELKKNGMKPQLCNSDCRLYKNVFLKR